MTCGKPPSIAHAALLPMYSNDLLAKPGDTVVYQCGTDFDLKGSARVICLETGQWSELPQCLETTTKFRWPTPKPIKNMNVSTQLPLPVTQMINNQKIKVVTCSEFPPTVANAHLISFDIRPHAVGEFVEYRCESGYRWQTVPTINNRLNQPGFSECLETGEWSIPVACERDFGASSKEKVYGTIKEKVKQGCASLPLIRNAEIISGSKMEDFFAEEVVEFKCKPGFKPTMGTIRNPESDLSIKCVGDGLWEDGGACVAEPICNMGDVRNLGSSITLGELRSDTHMAICTTSRAHCSGTIDKWMFYSSEDSKVTFRGCIFRPKLDMNQDLQPGNRVVFSEVLQQSAISVAAPQQASVLYELVGCNLLESKGHAGVSINYIDPSQQIAVQDGDVYGVLYDNTSSLPGLAFTDGFFPLKDPLVDADDNLPLTLIDYESPSTVDSMGNSICALSHFFYGDALAFGTFEISNWRREARNYYLEAHIAAPLACTTGPLPDPSPGTSKSFVINMDSKISCEGEISSWQFYVDKVAKTSKVFFSVWRESVVADQAYSLIGYNEIETETAGQNYVEIDPNDRILVKPNDLVGIFYENEFDHFIGVANDSASQNSYSLPLTSANVLMLATSKGFVSLSRSQPANAPLVRAMVTATHVCPDPPKVEHAVTRTFYPSGQRPFAGDRVRYICPPQFALVGHQEIECFRSGHWSPAPSCKPLSQCTAGGELSDYLSTDVPIYLDMPWFSLCPENHVVCSGTTEYWEFYGITPELNEPQAVYLSIWRAVGNNRYRLIGEDVIVTNSSGVQRHKSSGHEVQRGDILSIYYDRNLAVGIIPYSRPKMWSKTAKRGLTDNFIDGPGSLLSSASSACISVPMYKPDIEDKLNDDRTLDMSTATGGSMMMRTPKHYTMKLVVQERSKSKRTCGPVYTIPGGEIVSGSERVLNKSEGALPTPGDWVHILCKSAGTEVFSECSTEGTWTPEIACPDFCSWNKLHDDDFHELAGSSRVELYASSTISCSGLASYWEFISETPRDFEVAFDVWRRTTAVDMDKGQLRLVGSTLVSGTGLGRKLIRIPDQDQFAVSSGDLIAVRYSARTEPFIPYKSSEWVKSKSELVDVIHGAYTDEILRDGVIIKLIHGTVKKREKLPAISLHLKSVQMFPYGICGRDVTCPKDSECVFRGCFGHVCICQSGFWPNSNRTRCLPEAQFGDKCGDELSACADARLQCNPKSGRCECVAGFVAFEGEGDSIKCRENLSSSGMQRALLNETCDHRRKCSFDQHCVDGICQCAHGLKTASELDRRAFPDSHLECRSEKFTWDIVNAAEECPGGTVAPLVLTDTGFDNDGNEKHLFPALVSLVVGCLVVVGGVLGFYYVRHKKLSEVENHQHGRKMNQQATIAVARQPKNPTLSECMLVTDIVNKQAVGKVRKDDHHLGGRRNCQQTHANQPVRSLKLTK